MGRGWDRRRKDMTRLLNQNSTYKEDIPVVAPGYALVGSACMLWDMTISVEDTAVIVINFSDTATAYDSAYRNEKVVLNGPTTLHIVFPNGKYCSRGLCVIANNGSADISVTYD
jgi:hypothetical protein